MPRSTVCAVIGVADAREGQARRDGGAGRAPLAPAPQAGPLTSAESAHARLVPVERLVGAGEAASSSSLA